MSDSASQPASESPAFFPRAASSAAAWCRFLTPAILGLAADLWLKYYAFPDGVAGDVGRVGRHPGTLITDDGFMSNAPQQIIPNILGFTTTVNRGAVFGFAQGMVFYFLIFSLFAMALILWVFITSKRSQWVVHIALGMITAGALGNLYDRAMFGGVRDMLKLMFIQWNGRDYYPYIFNIADVMLCVGVPLLMICWFAAGLEDRRSKEKLISP